MSKPKFKMGETVKVFGVATPAKVIGIAKQEGYFYNIQIYGMGSVNQIAEGSISPIKDD